MNAASTPCRTTRLTASSSSSLPPWPRAWRCPALSEATTSAFTIERLDSIHAECRAQRRKYSAWRPRKPRKQPKQRYDEPPRVLPRLKPNTFRLFGPNSDARVQGPEHYQRTQRLRILNLLLHDPTSELHDLFRAYTRLYQLPGGTSLLSPHDMRKLIVRMSKARQASINPREALSRIISLLDGAVAALQYYSGSRTAIQTDEVQEWYSLLTDEDVSRRMVGLVTQSLRRPSRHELKDALLLFQAHSRSHKQQQLEQGPTPSLLSYNLLLNLVVRSIPSAPIRQDYYRQGEAEEGIDYDPDGSAHLDGPWRPQDVAEQTKTSFRSAMRLFTALWSAIKDAGLKHDEFSHAARIKLECKRAAFEVMDDLEAAMADGQVADVDADTQGEPPRQRFKYARKPTPEAHHEFFRRGWDRVRDAVRQASRSQQLSQSHVNQVVGDFARLRLRVKLKMEHESVALSPRTLDEYPSLKPFASTAVSSQLVQEVYSTLRWNEVQFEMLSLREAEGTVTRQDIGEGTPSSSWFPIFWSLFGRSPAAKADNGPTESLSAGENTQRPIVELLGMSLPPEYRPDTFTYLSLMRYYGSVEAEYDRTMEIVEDYRQSATPTPTPMTLPLLDVIIRSFALHGVPADLGTRWDSARNKEVYEWTLHPDVKPGSAMSKWNVVNLLPFLEETLRIMPARSPRQVKEQEERQRYIRIAAGEDDGGGGGEVLSESLLRSNASAGSQAPKPNEVWTWIVALRRVTGDRYNELVLDWYDRWRIKFGPSDGGEVEEKAGLDEDEEEEEQDVPPDTNASPLSSFFAAADKSLLRHQSLSMYADHAKVAKADVRHADPRANRQGWKGWRDDDERLKSMIEFVRQRKEMLG